MVKIKLDKIYINSFFNQLQNKYSEEIILLENTIFDEIYEPMRQNIRFLIYNTISIHMIYLYGNNK